MSKCIKQITIQNTIQLEGSNGTKRYFIPNEQYCFEEIVPEENTCGSCENGSPKYNTTLYYVVRFNDELYYVPDDHAVHDIFLVPDKFKSARAYYDQLVIQPANWKEVYKEITGFDITTTEKVQYNGEALLRKIRASENQNTDE